MKKKTNQKVRSKKKRKPGNKKFSQALIGGAFIALGCGCFAYPNFREWNTQREVEQIIDNFDKTYSQGLDSSIADKAANAEGEEQNESQNNKKTDGNTTATETPQPEQSESSAGDSAAEQTVGDTDEKNAADESADNGSDNTISTRPYQYLYDEMDKYNKNLAQNGQSISDAWSYEQQPMDLDSLNIDSDNPIIGYIEIPDMKIRLPLMLGASSKNLEKGAAVLSQTSMPIGGENTNCVIAGHRGWEGSAYFQYIENMKVGSKVYITNPWETLVYECTSIKVIYPDDVNSILIQPGKDMVTLFSCHPYVLGGGPYRYLVFCERVDTQKRQEVDGILNPKSEEEPAENTDDITITDRMQQVCSLVGIQLVDHIIIGVQNDKSYYSFMEKSVLPMEAVRFAKTVDELKWDVPVAAEGTNPYHKESVLGKLQSKKTEVAKKSTKSVVKKTQDIDL